ncbi:MAG: hypothetical protein Tsb0020_54710 [Haliangiales bacterium]
MSAVIVFAPKGAPDDDDDPLVRTRWMADRTIERLADADVPTETVLDHNATRAGLETVLSAEQEVAGLVMLSHGRAGSIEPGRMVDDAVMGADGPALDADNSALLHDRWGHAIACHAGTELAARACQAGAVCFAGYDTALHVDWHPNELSDELLPLLARLVTETSHRLAACEFDHQALQRAVNDIADEIEAWCESQPDDAPEQMLVITAQQFVERLVVRCRDAESP